MPKALRHRRRSAAFLLAACLVSAPAVAAPAPPGPEGGAAVSTWLDRTPDREIIYFVLPDRFENGDVANDKGGLAGGRLQTGFDPTHKGFFHGGDLKGLRERLDYVAGLGATANMLGHIYKNKPVHHGQAEESSGYQ